MKIPGRVFTLFLLPAFALLSVSLCPAGCRSDGNKKKGITNNARVIPVEVRTLEKGDISRTIHFVGELRASESVEISSNIPGRIEKIHVHMGDRVEEGVLLVRVDDTELKAQLQETKASLAVFKASVNKAAAEHENAEAQLERKEKLAGKKLITPQELDNIRTAAATAAASVEVARSQLSQGQARTKLLKSQLSDSKIKAPFSGEIDARYLDVGAVVNPGTPILKLVKKEPIVVRFQVEERYIGDIWKKKDEGEISVQVEVDAYSGEMFTGKIVRFSPGLQSESRTAVVEAEILNDDGRLMPGMYCRVNVDFGMKREVLIVPLNAILEDIEMENENHGKNTGKVYVVEEGKARLVQITLGWKQGDMAEVAGGLKEGDRVVVEGQASLQNGADVKVVGGAGGKGQAEKDGAERE